MFTFYSGCFQATEVYAIFFCNCVEICCRWCHKLTELNHTTYLRHLQEPRPSAGAQTGIYCVMTGGSAQLHSDVHHKGLYNQVEGILCTYVKQCCLNIMEQYV